MFRYAHIFIILEEKSANPTIKSVRTIIVIKELLHQPIKMPDSCDSTELWTIQLSSNIGSSTVIATYCMCSQLQLKKLNEENEKRGIQKEKTTKQSYHKMMSRYYVLYYMRLSPMRLEASLIWMLIINSTNNKSNKNEKMQQ